MKLSIMPVLKLSALPAVAALLLGCKADSTVAVASQELSPVKPAVTNVLTNSIDRPPPQLEAPPPEPVTAAPAAAVPKVSPSVQEVVDLAERGVGDDVLVAFVGKAPSPFNLTAEEILYLNDLGISEVVITAMIRHRGLSENAVVKPATVQTNNVAAAQPSETVNPPVSPPAVLTTVAPAPSVSIAATPEFEAAPQTPVVVSVAPPPTVQTDYFYSALEPYGSWIQVPDYGLCWQPTVVVVNPSWRPYCDRGRWLYSDCGWYWHSDYSWGWAPFHYGRWQRHPHRGWLWTPDAVWGPAWVTWRYSDAYCGWAPLPPGAYYDEHIGLSFRSGRVGISFDFGLGIDCYTFVPSHRFYDRTPWRHALPPHRVADVHRNTTVINNYVQINKTIVNEGISRDRLAKINQSEIRKVAIRDAPKESGRGVTIKPDRLEKNGSELVVYRPQLPRPVTAISNHREQQEVRKPSSSTPAGRSVNSTVAGRESVPSIPIGSRLSSKTESPTRPVIRTGPASGATAVGSLPAPASARTDTSLSEASTTPRLNSPPLFKSSANSREAISSDAQPSRSANTTSDKRATSPQVPSWPVATPSVKPNPIAPITPQPVTSANEARSASTMGPRLVPTPVRPSPYREQPRPINPAPTVAQNVTLAPSSSPTASAGQPSPSLPSLMRPSSPDRSLTYPPAQVSGSGGTIPSTARQTPLTAPQPYSPIVSGSDSRRELQKPPSITPVEKPAYSQPVPSYQPQSYPGSGRQPVAAPSMPSAPQYSPPTRSAPPSVPSVSPAPSTRFQSPSVQVPSQAIAPSSARPAPPSVSPQSPRSSGSTRRNETEK